MSQPDILRGNYKIPNLKEKLNQPTKATTEKTLGEEFETAALKKLGGSITFVKKSGSFVWEGKDKKSE